MLHVRRALSALALATGAAAGQQFFVEPTLDLPTPLVFEFALASADVDGDGSSDLVAASGPFGLGHEPETLSIALSTGCDAFASPIVQAIAADTVRDDALGDVDGDGAAEWVTLTTDDAVEVHSFDGSGFVLDARIELPETSRAIAVGSVDRDSASEVLVGGAFSGRVRIDDLVGGQLVLAAERAGSIGVVDLATGDVDGNGLAEIVTLVDLSSTSLGVLTPFLGGVLVPTPDVIVSTTTDADGRATISVPWRDPVPGLELYVQAWYPTQPASTIALRGTTLR